MPDVTADQATYEHLCRVADDLGKARAVRMDELTLAQQAWFAADNAADAANAARDSFRKAAPHVRRPGEDDEEPDRLDELSRALDESIAAAKAAQRRRQAREAHGLGLGGGEVVVGEGLQLTDEGEAWLAEHIPEALETGPMQAHPAADPDDEAPEGFPPNAWVHTADRFLQCYRPGQGMLYVEWNKDDKTEVTDTGRIIPASMREGWWLHSTDAGIVEPLYLTDDPDERTAIGMAVQAMLEYEEATS